MAVAAAPLVGALERWRSPYGNYSGSNGSGNGLMLVLVVAAAARLMVMSSLNP